MKWLAARNNFLLHNVGIVPTLSRIVNGEALARDVLRRLARGKVEEKEEETTYSSLSSVRRMHRSQSSLVSAQFCPRLFAIVHVGLRTAKIGRLR